MADSRFSSPLRIDPVIPDNCSGLIGMVICPGRKVSFAMGDDWDRDLDNDLQAIRDWGASALVSLMEKDEMEFYGVGALPEKTVRLGMSHYHLPIRDMDVPRKSFERQWRTSGVELRDRLLSGQSIVIHCLGGLGRTGTITGRLLVELGSDPETAIRRVRGARAGTIQTIMQEAYVRNCKPLDINRVE